MITGVSTGIGYGLAKGFLNFGYTVYGSVRKKEDEDRLSKELGDKFRPLCFDVTDHVAVDAVAGRLEKEVEGLAGLINNAGVAVGGPLMDIDIEQYRYQFEVNVIGLVKVTQAFLPLLGARKNHQCAPGKIVQISSVAGKIGMPFLSAYAGSKHAVEGISQSLRKELQLYGIDVILIGSGAVKTPIWIKSASEGLVAEFEKSPFHEAMGIFRNTFVKNAIKNGWTSEKLAEIILRAFEKEKANTRYALVAQRFKNWTLPRLLPDRVLDRFVGKKLKLIKK